MIDTNRLVKIKVIPNASKSEIVSYGDIVKVRIAAEPEKSKANLEVIRFFSKLTGKRVRIVSGLTSRTKILKFF